MTETDDTKRVCSAAAESEFFSASQQMRFGDGTLFMVKATHDAYSPSVRRVLDLPRPKWRGKMHKWMIPVAAAGCIFLVAVAQSDAARGVALGYGLAAIGLYSASALAHYRVWEPSRLHKLFMLDQSMILVYIAASTAPVAYAVGGGLGWLLVGGMSFLALAGIVTIWLPFHPPRGMMNTIFLITGWWPIFFVVPIARGIGGAGIAILLAGGAVFTVGALIVGGQRPNPNPYVFGYHEIWHVFVIVGSVVHFVLFALILTGKAPL